MKAQAKFQSPGWAKSILYSFFDFDDISGVNISTADLRASAEVAVEAGRQGAAERVVAIYAKGDLPYALSRMWMVYAERSGWETAVFRDRADAVNWVRERVAVKFGVKIAVK